MATATGNYMKDGADKQEGCMYSCMALDCNRMAAVAWAVD